MLGPYTAQANGRITYTGNKVFSPLQNVAAHKFTTELIKNRVAELQNQSLWKHIFHINHRINLTANQFFDEIGAQFVALPLTTRMISSPGALYGKEKLDYTTDVTPVKLKWFNLRKPAFLAESAQLYLELALVQPELQQVYSIYNSFRKEKTDITHLSEFHHVEYEGKVKQDKNERIALNLIGRILDSILQKNNEDIAYFLHNSNLDDLKDLATRLRSDNISKLTFREALDKLHEATKEQKYTKFTLKHFGIWEEIKLTELMQDLVVIKEFPLLEVPFYHAQIDDKVPPVADNADIIWPNYIEIMGTGHRVRSLDELILKAKIYNLPKSDYKSYLQTRKSSAYTETSGFGLGWERLLQGLLQTPFIWSAAPFPRTHSTLKP